MRSRATVAAVTSAQTQTPPVEAASKSSKKAPATRPAPQPVPEIEETQ